MTDNEQSKNPASDPVQINELRTDELQSNELQSDALRMNALQIEALRRFMTDAVPYWKTLGLELIEVGPGHAVFQAHVHPGLLQNNVVHGGVLASIADSACAVAAISKVFPESYATTINLQMAYMKPLKAGRFTATGKCLKAGRSVFFCEATVVDEHNVLICSASSQLIAVSR
jgi:uncharacterized protein (TIGR00369 family)